GPGLGVRDRAHAGRNEPRRHRRRGRQSIDDRATRAGAGMTPTATQLPSRADATASTADGAGTLEALVREVSYALEPLQDALGPTFFLRLGCELPREIADDAALLGSLGAARDKAGALTPKSAALASAIADGDDTAIVSAGAALLACVGELVAALGAVGTAV